MKYYQRTRNTRISSGLPHSTTANNQIGSRRRPLVAAAVVLASVTLANAASAQNAVWINSGNGSSPTPLTWSLADNWQGGATPEAVSFYPADFSTLDITGDRTVTLSGPGSAAGLIFGDTDVSSAGSWTLYSADPANVLTLTGYNGGTNTIVVNPLGTGKNATISANLNVTGGLLSKQGNGTLVLSGSTKLNSNQLEVTNGGTLLIKGATTDASRVFVRGTSTLILDTGAALTSGVNNGGNYLSIGVDGKRDILADDGVTVVGTTPADDVTAIMRGNATWTHTGGDFNVSDNTGSRGTLTLEGTASLSSTGTIYVSKQADTVASLTIKDSSSVSTNGNLVVGMRAGSNGSLVQNGGSLSVAGETWIGNEAGGNGTFTKTAGTMTANNWFVVGRFGSTGVFDFSGGTLTKSNGGQMLIADGGGSVGTMNMSGTANLTVNNGLWVGQNGGNGTLNMSGGTISSNDWMIIGRQTGTGVFNFSGGTVNSNGGQAFVIADKADSDGTNPTTGTLNMSGTAELNMTREFWVGNGVNSTGTLNMKGGTVRINNWVAIGRGGGTGIFNMEGGSFLKESGDGQSFIVGTGGGTGTLNQTGGTMTLTSGQVWIGEGATGTWNMSGGSLKSGNLIVGRNGGSTATLNLSGNAQVNTGFFSVGQFDTVKGNVTIAENATLNVARILVGDAGTAQGTVTQTGGTVTEVDGDTAENRIGNNVGTTGTYNLQGGKLLITKNNLQIGASGIGTFNQSGGEAAAGTYPSIGRYAGGVGTMNLSGGKFSQVGENGNFIVGEEGTGTLNVSGTGLLEITGRGPNGGGGLVIGLVAAAPEIPGIPADGDIPAVPAVPAVPGGNGTVNLDGGTIRTDFVEARFGKAQLNLNGGTLQAGKDQFEFFPGFTPDNTNADLELKAGGVILDTQGFSVATSANLDGVGGVTKKGSGSLILWGNNTYTGTTKINEGTLVLAGSIAGSVAVGSGATFDAATYLPEFVLAGGNTLSGSGTVLGKVRLQNGARIAPGDITAGKLTLQTGLALNDTGGNTLEFGLGTVSDLLAIVGGTFLGNHTGVTTISISDAGGFGEGVYTLMTWSGSTAQDVDLSDFQLNLLPNGLSGSLQLGTDSLQLTVIPEPNTAAVLAMTSVGVLGFRRRRRG
ncbi:beta strand repeat-containing protein [Verrucomicrobiota bacterium sgz303538]